MEMDIKYFIMILFTGLISSCTLTSTTPSDQGPKQAVGTITGMVLGGKIANDLTEDSSKNNLWTLAGVTLGAFLGNEIGASMDKTDILMAQNARNYALENNKVNSQAAGKTLIVEIQELFILPEHIVLATNLVVSLLRR
jgi:uncharacterized protein YcfJ